MRAVLQKNIYPQGPRSAVSIKKYLENGRLPESNIGEEEPTTDADNGSKWDKTDSECKFRSINIDVYLMVYPIMYISYITVLSFHLSYLQEYYPSSLATY